MGIAEECVKSGTMLVPGLELWHGITYIRRAMGEDARPRSITECSTRVGVISSSASGAGDASSELTLQTQQNRNVLE